MAGAHAFHRTPDKRATAVSVNLRPGLRFSTATGDVLPAFRRRRLFARASSGAHFLTSRTPIPRYVSVGPDRSAGLGQHGKPWRSQVAGAFQLPQLWDAAFPAFPQFCLKIFTFAGIIVQSELTNQCEAYLRDCVGRQNPSWMEVETMRKLLTALVAAASIGAAAIATSSSAEAWRGGWGWGWGPGAVVGGVIAGAVVGSAIASRPYYYPYGYYGYGPNPYYGPPCGRVWNGYAWVPAC